MVPHSPPQMPQPGDRLTLASSFNGLNILANAHAVTLTPFFRTDFGSEGIGMPGVIGIFLILGWGSAFNCYPMFIFFIVWIAAVICQRVKTFINWRTGVISHSFYNGYPWLVRRFFPRLSEPNAKAVEAFACFGIGGVIAQFVPPLGWYLMLGLASILFSEAVIVEQSRRRLQAMRDAEIEQRYLAEKYRQGRF
ncbi:MAG: hypothetical protein SFV23_15475 [Planctomycetaceae bacterium]|nr:hypothetical protein [Planctomycetaceae bacterium]